MSASYDHASGVIARGAVEAPRPPMTIDLNEERVACSVMSNRGCERCDVRF